jgi:hypothetical protein
MQRQINNEIQSQMQFWFDLGLIGAQAEQTDRSID